MRNRLLVIIGCLWLLADNVSVKAQPQTTTPSQVEQHYPDFGYLPPPREYKGRVFSLSQKYPTRQPESGELPDFLKLDYQRQWRDYLLAARAYCFKDNVLGGDVENDFDAAEREAPTWFHVPWQHYGPSGREGVHGLTKEAPVQVQQLSESQMYQGGQTYAVGLYNRFGGFTIGKVWADKEHPDAKKARFPVGTVVMKLLFTDVPPEQIPSLNEPLLWTAYVTENYRATNRVFKKLSLIQMDLMVRDPRSPHGWVFGTYQYNGQQKQTSKWDNLVPVGVQWGNDPGVKADEFTNRIPRQTKRNPNLKETIINPDDGELPPTHLGWNGRLNGPVDNYMSSCMSCHMTAQAPAKSPMSPLFLPKPDVPPVGSDTWMRWFQNLNCGERFDKDKPTSSTDFSLQIALSLQNFYDWRNAGSKIVAARYKRSHSGTADAADDAEFKIQRDSTSP